MVGLMATSSKRAYAIPKSAALRAPAPVAVHCWSIPRQEMLKHSSFSASVMSLGPGVHKACLSAWASLAGMGFDSKHEFAPPMSCWGLSFALGHGISPQRSSSAAQPLLQHLLSSCGFSDLAGALSNWDCFSFSPSKTFMAKQNLQSWSGK